MLYVISAIASAALALTVGFSMTALLLCGLTPSQKRFAIAISIWCIIVIAFSIAALVVG